MDKSGISSRKITLVGAGAVGSATAFALAQAGVAEEIVLTDRNGDLAKGQALDLAHGAPFYRTVSISACPAPEAYEGAAMVIVSAGKAQAGPGQSRLDLLKTNVDIVSGIAEEVRAVAPRAIVLVASNPVDVLTHLVQERTGWPKGRMFGSGTVLDSARLRWLLAKQCGVAVQSVHAAIMGEHGDSEFAAWSLATIGGMPLDGHCGRCGKCAGRARRAALEEEVRRSAYHIIGYKGSTSFGVAMAMAQIARAVLRNERRVLTVSARLEGEYGLRDVTLGVPCVVGAGGVEEVLEARLSPEEQARLEASAAALAASMAGVRE